jgi:hypothetical protein
MTIKVVTPRIGGAGGADGRSTDTIIRRLGVMRTRSAQLLHEMEQLQEQFRQHSARINDTHPTAPTDTTRCADN